jgi:hypothetical protein
MMIMEPFKQLILDHGTNDSSTMMWFVTYVCDPGSTLRNLPENLRVETLLENGAIEKMKYQKHKQKIEELMVAYYKLVETPAARQLRIWNKKMDEKSAFMEITPYDGSTFEMLEKMMSSNAKIYNEYDQIMKKIAMDDDGVTRGGATESLTDRGEI